MWRDMITDPKVLRHHAKSFEALRPLDLVEIDNRVDL